MRVTVIMPNRDGEATVSEAIKSAYTSRQEHFGLRLCVVDDGSQDASVEVITEATDGDNETDIISIDQSVGPARARNLAIQSAWDVTDVFAFLDSDDAYEPGFLNACVGLFSADPNIGLIYCDELVADEIAQRTYVRYKEPFVASRLLETDIVGGGFAVSKAALHRFGLFDEQMSVNEMYELALRVGMGSAVIHIPCPLLRTRLTKQSLRNTRSPTEWSLHAEYARQKVQHGSKK